MLLREKSGNENILRIQIPKPWFFMIKKNTLLLFFICMEIGLLFTPSLITVCNAKQPVNVYFDMGYFAFQSNDFQKAENYFKQAIELNPKSPIGYHYLGKTCMKLEKYEQARAQLSKAFDLEPDLPDLKYDIALLDFQTQNYAESSKRFIELAASKPSDPEVAFLAGMSLFKQGKPSEALPYFLTAKKNTSIQHRAEYYAGMCLYMNGEVQAAIEKFTFVQLYATDPELKGYAETWISKLKTVKQADPYSLDISLKYAYQFDDNFQLEPNKSDIFAEEDQWVQLVSFISAFDAYVTPHLMLGSGFDFSRNAPQALSGQDITTRTLRFYGNYQIRNALIGLEYCPPQSRYYSGDEPYMEFQEIRANLLYSLARDIHLKTGYFRSDDNDEEWYRNTYSLNLFYSLDKERGYCFGGGEYEDNVEDDPDDEYEIFQSMAGTSLKLPWDFNIGLITKLSRRNFKNIDSGYGFRRKDSKLEGYLSLSRPIFYPYLEMIAEYYYTRNDSNNVDFDYTRNVFSLAMKVSY